MIFVEQLDGDQGLSRKNNRMGYSNRGLSCYLELCLAVEVYFWPSSHRNIRGTMRRKPVGPIEVILLELGSSSYFWNS